MALLIGNLTKEESRMTEFASIEGSVGIHFDEVDERERKDWDVAHVA